MLSADERRAAHRVNVGERVRRGDPAEVVWVVDDRRKEIDRLQQRETVSQQVDAGIVAAGIAHEHPVAVAGETRSMTLRSSAAPSFAAHPAHEESSVRRMPATSIEVVYSM